MRFIIPFGLAIVVVIAFYYLAPIAPSAIQDTRLIGGAGGIALIVIGAAVRHSMGGVVRPFMLLGGLVLIASAPFAPINQEPSAPVKFVAAIGALIALYFATRKPPAA